MFFIFLLSCNTCNSINVAEKLYVGEGALYGVDINTGGIADSYANFVWEPAVVKVYRSFPLLIKSNVLFYLVACKSIT